MCFENQKYFSCCCWNFSIESVLITPIFSFSALRCLLSTLLVIYSKARSQTTTKENTVAVANMENVMARIINTLMYTSTLVFVGVVFPRCFSIWYIFPALKLWMTAIMFNTVPPNSNKNEQNKHLNETNVGMVLEHRGKMDALIVN